MRFESIPSEIYYRFLRSLFVNLGSLDWSHDLLLLLNSLESSVTVLGGGVNELDIDLLSLPGFGGGEDGLTENNWSLSGTSNSSLNENVVLVDNTVVGESTEWSDVLDDGISSSGGVVLNSTDGTSSDLVDLLVELGSAMVTHLTASSNCPLDSGWMPGSNTSDLSATSMRFTLESLDTESLDDTLSSLTAGHTNGINALVLLEDLRDLDLLLKVILGPVDLLLNVSSVNLDLHEVSLVLSELELADLGGAYDTDGTAVFLYSLEISGDGVLGALLVFVTVLLEGVLLGLVPVLVESTEHFLVEVLSPDGSESAETTWSLDVSDNTNDLHWWALNNGASVYPVSLDKLLTLTTLLDLDNVSHTGLVTAEGGETDFLGGIVSWE